MAIYADTSFLLPLYLPDRGDARSEEFMSELSEPMLLTALQEAELRNSARLRVAQRRTSSPEVAQALALLQRDISEDIYTWLEPDWPAVFRLAEEISQKYTERGAHRFPDLLHLACALDLKAKVFLSFDRRQSKLAKNLGMKTPF